MNFQYCFDKSEVLQYRFLSPYLKDRVSDYEDCFCLWCYEDDTPVSLALYGMGDASCAHLIYMKTIPGCQLLGYQSLLQKEAERKLTGIGVKSIHALVNEDTKATPGALSPAVQEELLILYGFKKEALPKSRIVKYANNRDRILKGLSPREFLNKTNKTNEIIDEKELSLSKSYRIQLYRAGIRWEDNEHGLFAVNEGMVKAAIIYKDSGLYDFKLSGFANLTEGQNFTGSLLITYIITHGVKKPEEYTFYAPATLDMQIMENILGAPVFLKELFGFKKEL